MYAQQYSGAVRPSRPSYRDKSPRQYISDPKDVSLSPPKRKRSKSPLRQDRPSEVFQRSPESHRHHVTDRVDLPSSALARSPRTEHNPRSTDLEACLAWLHRNCFKEMIQIERTLEEHKSALAEQSDFNLTETFGFFSANSLARLAHYDLSSGLA